MRVTACTGLGQVGHHLRGLGAVAIERGEKLQRSAGVASKHRLQEIEDAPAVGKTEQPAHRVSLDLAGTEGDGAVEDGECVAHRAFRRPGDQHQSRALRLGAFLRHDRGKMQGEHVHLDALQIEALTARQHRHRHFAHLGGGEDELHMLGRLFQRLEQTVEGLLRQHMHLVDDVDLVAGGVGLVVGAVDQVADVVDAGMGGRVHLHHVEMPALQDGAAVLALLAHVQRRPAIAREAHIVERARDQPRGGGLADPAHAGEHIGLRNAPGGEGIAQGLDHGVLADQLGEDLGPVFARQGRMAARGRRRRRATTYGALRRLLIFGLGHG